MPFTDRWNGIAAEEALLGGQPLTSLEATLYFGYADLAKKVTRMRQRRHAIRSRSVRLPAVLARIEAALGTPASVHPMVRARAAEITVVEYYRPTPVAAV